MMRTPNIDPYSLLREKTEEALSSPTLASLAVVEFELEELLFEVKESVKTQQIKQLLGRVQALATRLKQLLRALDQVADKKPAQRQQVLNGQLLSLLQEVSHLPPEIIERLRLMPTEVKQIAVAWPPGVRLKLPPDLQPTSSSSSQPPNRPSASKAKTSSVAPADGKRSGDSITLDQFFLQVEELRYRGKWEAAIKRYDAILQAQPNHAKAKEAKQKVLAAKWRGDPVFEQLPEAVKRAFQMALSHERMGLHQEARALLEEARREALSHGIKHWNDLEERFRTIEQIIAQEETLAKVRELVKEERWEEGLLLLQQLTNTTPTAEYQAELEKLQLLNTTYHSLMRQLQALEQRLRQAEARPAVIETIINDLEEVADRLQPLLEDYPHSTRLRQIEAEVEALRGMANQEHKQGSQKLQELLDQAQMASDIEHKTLYLREATKLSLEVIPTSNSNLRIHDLFLALLDLSERANQTIRDIELNLDSADYRETREACQRFEEIRPALLYTRKLNELQESLVDNIRRHIKDLTQAKEYHLARQMIRLLKKELFREQISKKGIQNLERMVHKAEKRPWLTRQKLLWFLSGIIVASIFFFLLYLSLNR